MIKKDVISLPMFSDEKNKYYSHFEEYVNDHYSADSIVNIQILERVEDKYSTSYVVFYKMESNKT